MVLTLAAAFVSAALALLVSAFCRSVMASTLVDFLLCGLFFVCSLAVGRPATPFTGVQFVRLLNSLEIYVRIFSEPWANASLGEVVLTFINAILLALSLILLTGWILPGIL